MNEIVCGAFNSVGAHATREPQSISGCSDKRPYGVTQIPWTRGCVWLGFWDAACRSFAKSYVLVSSRHAGSAAIRAKQKKLLKYDNLNHSRVDFVPLAIDISGVWGEQALSLVTEIGRRIVVITHDPRTTAFLISSDVAIVVSKGTSVSI